MWKKTNVLILVLFAVLISACQNAALYQSPPVTSPMFTKTIHPTLISTTARPPTPTISAGFLAMLSTETPLVTPTYGTPLPVLATPQLGVNEIIYDPDEENIKNVIQEYLDRRYYAFSLSNTDGIPDTYFNDLLSDGPETSAFITLELAKLRMDLKHFELNNLKYAAYEYFLGYDNITFDPVTQKATVHLLKRENTIHEISALLAAGEPIMSSGDEKHTIILHKEDEKWKIISDTYRDFVWRMLTKSAASPDEILNTLETMIQNMESAPKPSSLNCFREGFTSQELLPAPEENNPPSEGLADSSIPIHPGIKQIYLNGKNYDPEWPYSNPFINLYLQSDGDSPLRFIVELDSISENLFLSDNPYPDINGWQVIIFPHSQDQNTVNQPILILDLDEKTSCDSRPALYKDTTLKEIQEEFGNHRVYDYKIVNGKGEILLEHSFYLNPPGGYLISDTYGDLRRSAGGIVGYPYLLEENKTVFSRAGKVITVPEPRGGFYQLQYYAKPAIRWYAGLWTEETPFEIIIQAFLYRDDGEYDSENAYTFPEHSKIKQPKNFDFEVSFTFNQLNDALGDGNAFYIRFLNKDGNIVGEDYFYLIPYSPPTS